jgi:hypothetical protein
MGSRARARSGTAFTKGADDGEQTKVRRMMTTKTSIAGLNESSAVGRGARPRAADHLEAWSWPRTLRVEGTPRSARGEECAPGLRGCDARFADGMTSTRTSRSCAGVVPIRSQVIFRPRQRRDEKGWHAMAGAWVTARNPGSHAGTKDANKDRVRRFAEIAAHFRVAHDRPPVETLGLHALTEAKWRRVACRS